jgi:molecular chaperone Hsp33
VTATILVRETMSPENRVQGILQAAGGKSRMVGDSHPDGATRGLVQMAKGAKEMTLTKGGVLQMMRTLYSGQVHQGIVAVPETGSVSSALMQYMQESEQVFSVIAVGCAMKGEEVVAAGGYIVQLLPEVVEAPLAVMTERLTDFASMEPLFANGMGDPRVLMSELLYGMPHTIVGEDSVRFGCQCSATRLAASLATLPKAEIESFLADGKLLEITCDYCGREYGIHPEQLRGLTSRN